MLDLDPEGQLVVAGPCSASLDGAPHHGARDVFVSQLSPGSDRAWTRSEGTSALDITSGVAIAPDGRIVVTGNTWGDLGAANQGSGDVFVLLIDPATMVR